MTAHSSSPIQTGDAHDLQLIEGFLEPALCQRVRAAMEAASGAAATLSGQSTYDSVDARVRSVTRLVIAEPMCAEIHARLRAHRKELEIRFGVALDACEEPQFLRYQRGDFFVAHQDGNTPLIRDATLQRRISVVIFVNATCNDANVDGYSGGALVLHAPLHTAAKPLTLTPAAGCLLAFRSETTHEVLPVTRGPRYTIASWFRAPTEDEQHALGPGSSELCAQIQSVRVDGVKR